MAKYWANNLSIRSHWSSPTFILSISRRLIFSWKINFWAKMFFEGRSVRPDLVKCQHFGKSLSLWLLFECFILGKILNLILQILMILDNFWLFLMAQYWKDNLDIWSHWCTVSFLFFYSKHRFRKIFEISFPSIVTKQVEDNFCENWQRSEDK